SGHLLLGEANLFATEFVGGEVGDFERRSCHGCVPCDGTPGGSAACVLSADRSSVNPDGRLTEPDEPVNPGFRVRRHGAERGVARNRAVDACSGLKGSCCATGTCSSLPSRRTFGHGP